MVSDDVTDDGNVERRVSLYHAIRSRSPKLENPSSPLLPHQEKERVRQEKERMDQLTDDVSLITELFPSPCLCASNLVSFYLGLCSGLVARKRDSGRSDVSGRGG